MQENHQLCKDVTSKWSNLKVLTLRDHSLRSRGKSCPLKVLDGLDFILIGFV